MILTKVCQVFYENCLFVKCFYKFKSMNKIMVTHFISWNSVLRQIVNTEFSSFVV